MKHLALRSKSMRNGDRPFTAPGLGDRVHSVLLGHLYSLLHDDKVTIHLTADKNDKPRKQQSWPEIISLFPDTVTYKDHDVQDLPENEWLAYLKENGYDAETYYYKDTVDMHPNDPPTSIPLPLDVSELLLKDYPLLQAKEEYAVFVPSKFVTAQWDTTDPGRSIPEAEINIIENRYKEQGYEIVRVGGEASIPDMNDSIQAIGYAMAKADGHIGIDSGFLHMANLYHKPEDIHLYTTGGYVSHHFIRAKARGVKIYNA